jgi:hypothetical protein
LESEGVGLALECGDAALALRLLIVLLSPTGKRLAAGGHETD